MQQSGSGTTRRDLAAKVPYFVNTNTKLWVGFEDKQSVRDKVNFFGMNIHDKYKNSNKIFCLELIKLLSLS